MIGFGFVCDHLGLNCITVSNVCPVVRHNMKAIFELNFFFVKNHQQ
jgi:hypothetical protein